MEGSGGLITCLIIVRNADSVGVESLGSVFRIVIALFTVPPFLCKIAIAY